MSESQARARSKSKRSNHAPQRAAAGGPVAVHGPSSAADSALGAFYSAGPVMGLGGGVQRQVAIGKADDAYEREAAVVADRVTSGKKVEPGDISKIEPGAISQTMPVQKAEAKPEQKVEDKKPVQKAEAKPEEKKPEPLPVQKAEEKKPEQKVEDKKLIQKADAKKPEEKKPEPKPLQKAEAKPEPKVEEKKPVQRAEAKPEEKKPESKPVQKAEARPEEKKPEPIPVQKAEISDEKPAEPSAPETGAEEQEPVQTQPAGAGGASSSSSMAAAAQQAIAGKGGGTSLNPVTRGALESSLGADLGHVRVHDDGPARQAARDLNARAFTHGSDIWLGPGASQNDLRLMAHEATHVVQQAGGVHRMVQRKKGADGPVEQSDVDVTGKTIKIPALRVPKNDSRKVDAIKKKLTGEGFPLPGAWTRWTDQRKVWAEKIVNDSGFRKKVSDKLKGKPGVPLSEKGGAGAGGGEEKKVHVLQRADGQEYYVIGTAETMLPVLALPNWDKVGNYHRFHVDHVLEAYLGGPNTTDNMELLDEKANESSGSKIQSEVDGKVTAAIRQYEYGTAEPVKKGEKRKKQKKWPGSRNVDKVRKSYQILFKELRPELDLVKNADAEENYWTLKEVKDEAKPLDQLKALSEKEIEKKGLVGNETRLVLYPGAGGGSPRRVPWTAGSKKNTDQSELQGLKMRGLDVIAVHYSAAEGKGKIKVKKKEAKAKGKGKGLKKPETMDLDLKEESALGYTAYVDGASVLTELKNAEADALSPIEFREAGLDGEWGPAARGVLRPTIPLLGTTEIDVTLGPDGIMLSKTFSAGEIALPPPLAITHADLTVAVGTGGLEVSGGLNFEIEKVGEGHLGAQAGVSLKGETGFEIEGEFTLDPKLIDTGKLKVWYRKEKFGGEGELGIKEGKVRGIKSASIKASYKDDRLDASGTAELSVPGIKTVNVALSYSEKDGLTLGGSFELADNIPGIQSGSGQALIKQKPGGEGYDVTASGKAVPKIPGISASIDIAYDNGALTIEGTAGYEKGMLKGSILVGVSNRPVGEDGKPAGDPGKKLTLYGGGSVTLKIAPWLQATAGIKLLPNGEVEVAGEIGLPKSLDIFPEKKLDKNIFTIGIDIPIVGVAVAGQRIGIFANISGGLDLSAGIGPGQLQELGLKVTYNPAHEDQTHIQGGAKLHIPAHAGLRLFVRGGLGVGIPIVSAQAGIEIGGQLGLEGALDAGVQVDWTPAKGLKLEAFGEIYVEPKFKFDITGFVLVQADLLITTIELYSKRWQLAAFEYGSGLRLGLKFPVKYEEGKPFDISLSDVQFQVPEIKPKELLSDLVKKIA